MFCLLFMGVPLGKSECKGFGKDVRFDSALRKVEFKIRLKDYRAWEDMAHHHIKRRFFSRICFLTSARFDCVNSFQPGLG
jgi:hypothetical protein